MEENQEYISKSEGKTLNSLVTKLNDIFTGIDSKLDNLTTNIKKLTDDDVVADIKQAAEASKLAVQMVTESLASVQKMEKQVNRLTYNYNMLKNENTALKSQIVQNDNYGRRNNLVLRGIKETADENCKDVILAFLKEKLDLADTFTSSVKFERCHRMGKKQQNWSRPIIVRFSFFSDRQIVWKNRHKLSKTPYNLHENFCNQTEYDRKKLYPIYRAAKLIPKYSQKITMIADRLVVDSVSYDVNTIGKLPDDIHPKNYTRKSNENTLVFGGALSEYDSFSNWSPSKINYDNMDYSCVEQAYMYAKAKANGDDTAAEAVMFTDDPREIKRIGSSIAINKEWENKRTGIMLKIVRAKFTQNEALKTELLASRGKKLGETGKDTVYAIGLPLTDRNVLNSSNWNGECQLGKILETIRDELS